MNDDAITAIVERLARIEAILDSQSKQYTDLKIDVKTLEDKVNKLEVEPDKKDAGRWRYIVDYIFKFIVAAIITFISVRYFGGK